jgi:hypothetical protein
MKYREEDLTLVNKSLYLNGSMRTCDLDISCSRVARPTGVLGEMARDRLPRYNTSLSGLSTDAGLSTRITFAPRSARTRPFHPKEINVGSDSTEENNWQMLTAEWTLATVAQRINLVTSSTQLEYPRGPGLRTLIIPVRTIHIYKHLVSVLQDRTSITRMPSRGRFSFLSIVECP